MSAPAPRLLRRWSVGRYTCELHGVAATATASAAVTLRWTPDTPTALTITERREFRRHRDEAIEDVARALRIESAALAQLLDDVPQPRADRGAEAKDERGHWNSDR